MKIRIELTEDDIRRAISNYMTPMLSGHVVVKPDDLLIGLDDGRVKAVYGYDDTRFESRVGRGGI